MNWILNDSYHLYGVHSFKVYSINRKCKNAYLGNWSCLFLSDFSVNACDISPPSVGDSTCKPHPLITPTPTTVFALLISVRRSFVFPIAKKTWPEQPLVLPQPLSNSVQ